MERNTRYYFEGKYTISMAVNWIHIKTRWNSLQFLLGIHSISLKSTKAQKSKKTEMSKRNNIFDWETRRHTYEFSTMVYRFVDVIFIIVGRSFLSCPHFEVQTASSFRGFV